MKSLVHFHFGNQVPRTGIPIFYLQTNEITSRDAITLIDTSAIIAQNSFFQQDTVIDLNESNLDYFVDKRGFVITDEFNDFGKPLYFKHEIQKLMFTDTTGTTNINIIDADGNQISSQFFKFDCGKNAVYHALDPTDGKVYFVVYPRADENNNIIDPHYQELLEAFPALKEADAEAIDECGLDPDMDQYILKRLDGQPHYFRIRLPRANRYNLRYTENGLLKIQVPQQSQLEPWYIDIQNSEVLTTHLTENIFLRYAISEFDNQVFYPFPPIKLVTDVEVLELAAGVLDLGFRNIFITNKTPLDIKIFDANKNLMRAMTTDINKIGKTINNIYWEYDSIISVDEATGRVKIYRNIKPGETVVANFFYETDRYTYTGWNFNPAFNDLALTKRIIMLVRPDATSCNFNISHVVMNSDTTLMEASDPDIQDWIDEGTKDLDDLIAEWTYVPGSSDNNQNNYLMLGILSTHTPISPDQSGTWDARRRGGGIIEEIQEQALKLIPGATNNWDIGFYDGPPAPIHGGIVVYLPNVIRNLYTETQLRAITSRYSAAGTYILLRYY